jgi:Uma2 family endonuclease
MSQPLISIPQVNPPPPPRETLPTMYDLPSENPEEPGLPDEFHDLQPQLLSATLSLSQYSKDQFFTGKDLNLYYDVHHVQWYKRPDWFLALGVPRLYEGKDMRSSYVVWQEGVTPYVIVELLSPGTEKEDLGRYAETPGAQPNSEALAISSRYPQGVAPETDSPDVIQKKTPSKWEVYEKILRVPHYIVFSRYNDRLRYFKLVGGIYEEQALDDNNPRIWIADLEVGLGIWEGEYDNIGRRWLRWCDQQGNWLKTISEREQQRAEREQQRAEREQQRAEREQQRAEREQQRADATEIQLKQVVLTLLDNGIAEEQIPMLTGLTAEQVRQFLDS